MEIMNIDKIATIKFTARTTLKGLNDLTRVVPEELMNKAAELGIATDMPQIWQYTGSDGNPDTEFLLEICVPVSEFKGHCGRFEFVELPAVSCLSQTHCGPWSNMGATYQKLMSEMLDKNLKYTGVTREVYVHCDFENQANCVTEVQVIL